MSPPGDLDDHGTKRTFFTLSASRQRSATVRPARHDRPLYLGGRRTASAQAGRVVLGRSSATRPETDRGDFIKGPPRLYRSEHMMYQREGEYSNMTR